MLRAPGRSDHGPDGPLPVRIAQAEIRARDPDRGMDVVLTAILAPEPPLRLPLGKDALQRIDNKLDRLARELLQWRPLAEQTGFEGPR